MRICLWLSLVLVTAVHGGETFQSGTLAVTATEDTADLTITYADIRDALVLDSSPANSSTYRYRIASLGGTTKTLTDASAVPVVVGTTVVVPSAPTAGQTTSLLYTPHDNEFTLFPITTTRCIPADSVCSVAILDPTGTTVLTTVDLRIDIQGVADPIDYFVPYPPSLSAVTVTMAAGASRTFTYQEVATLAGWTDVERVGRFYPYNQDPNLSGVPFALSGDSPGYVKYGDSFTITVAASQPAGTFLGFPFRFYNSINYDPLHPIGTNAVGFNIVVPSSGGTSSGGSSGGGGGCGAGLAGGLILVLLVCVSLRRGRIGD